MIRVTHSDHRLSPELLDAVRGKFAAHLTDQGADFLSPIRVDVLRKA